MRRGGTEANFMDAVFQFLVLNLPGVALCISPVCSGNIIFFFGMPFSYFYISPLKRRFSIGVEILWHIDCLGIENSF